MPLLFWLLRNQGLIFLEASKFFQLNNVLPDGKKNSCMEIFILNDKDVSTKFIVQSCPPLKKIKIPMLYYFYFFVEPKTYERLKCLTSNSCFLHLIFSTLSSLDIIPSSSGDL